MIYLDNAATTMHKPQAVIDAVTQAMCSLGNAGRGGGRGQRRRGRPHRGHHGPGLRLLPPWSSPRRRWTRAWPS